VILQALSCGAHVNQDHDPYFLPDERIITALSLAAYRGVEVDLVLPEHSNHPTVDWGSRVQMGPLLKAGCRVWTYPAPFNHSKLMTIDDLGPWWAAPTGMCAVSGSTLSWTSRSTTSGVVREIDALITAHQSARLSASALEGRPLPLRLRDGAARLLVPYL